MQCTQCFALSSRLSKLAVAHLRAVVLLLHAGSSAATQSRSQGRTAGSKRAATELAAATAAEPDSAAAAAATPSKRRRTAAAGASPTKCALTVKRKGRPQQQQQQDPAAALGPGTGSGFDALQGSADGAGLQGLGTGTEQQQVQQGLGCSTQVVVPLCVSTPQQQHQRNGAVGGGPQVPNYKAFRRRGEAQQQQQQVVVVDLVAADAAHLQGPDIDTFLRWVGVYKWVCQVGRGVCGRKPPGAGGGGRWQGGKEGGNHTQCVCGWEERGGGSDKHVQGRLRQLSSSPSWAAHLPFHTPSASVSPPLSPLFLPPPFPSLSPPPSLCPPPSTLLLRDEKHRQDRLRKADELFHAHLKPIKAPAAVAAGRAAGKTAATAARGRKK